MSSSVSIKQQYYKVQQYWLDALKEDSWKLAIWVAQYPDIEIIGQFLDIEASALGETDEILLKFESVYTTDNKSFEQDLWYEFQGWFDTDVDPKYDMHKALLEDHFLRQPFVPNTSLEPTIKNLLSEIERFRTSLVGIDVSFIIEFRLGRHQKPIGAWMQELLTLDIPQKIRFVVIDIAQKRLYNSFKRRDKDKIFEIHPRLKMVEAIKNEMKQTTVSTSPHTPDAKYKLTVLELMEALPNEKKMQPLMAQLLVEARKINKSIEVSSYLVIAHAYNTIKQPKKGLESIEKAIKDIELVEEREQYPLLRSCLLFKAAFLMAIKKEDEAFDTYELIAEKASKQKDYFYIMEAYRLCADLKLKKKKYNESFEYALLGLYGGSFMDVPMRRESTYVYLGNLAYNVVKYVVDSETKTQMLEEHLEKWIGKDWREKISIEENLNRHFAPLPETEEIITVAKK